jgi:hypothetical protein
MNEITRISPVTDDDAARLARPQTLADLASQITATPADAPDGYQRAGRRTGRGARRRALLVVPLVAGLSAAAAFVAVAASSTSAPPGAPGHPSGKALPSGPAKPSGPAQPATTAGPALAFTVSASSITVIVRDPLADPAVYRAEFAAHHLNITLQMSPVSPSLVGAVFYMDEPGTGPHLIPITAQGACNTPGGGDLCPVGVKVPAGFRGPATIAFGRTARPGEQYVSTGSAFAPGEAMAGMTVKGKTVAQVVAQLHARHVSVARFNVESRTGSTTVHSVPDGWYVYNAVPWAPGEVLLFVGRTLHEPVQAPAKGTPVPYPTASLPVPSPTS